ncbi:MULTISPECIES: hypothetical protein [Microbispora]|uniref:hypothetical protein n=1 Tax=Microbispora TaxID=2005 RepID=UPI0014052067|nr:MULTISPECIES: hypothetical protein [Microbispora]GLW26213.1 hypothetical protein Mame01_62550 [Microbispora amethystogenes]
MGKDLRTELRDISEIGAELDESRLQGINGGMDPEGAYSHTGLYASRDDVYC